MAKFSERLKQLRSEKKLTQQELADKVGVNRVTYTNWENGKREPELDKVVELAGELNCTLDYLLGKSDMNPLALETETLNKMSKEEIVEITDLCKQNIQSICEIGKKRFNCTDDEMNEILAMVIKEFNESQ